MPNTADWLLVVGAAAVVLAPGIEAPSVLVWLSALDAYVVAYRRNHLDEIGDQRRCSRRHRIRGTDVGFCEWCGDEAAGADPREGRA